MCGIVGVWDAQKQTTVETVAAMSACLKHRGPDDSGTYFADEYGISLAQQRLSLIDLSAAGHQPMQIGSHVIVYNGEVYNYQAIREELSALGISFTGDSDTEVVLRAWQQWGSDALDKFRGMFAFAIWDTKKQLLTLCRDRAGVKPLYLYHHDGLLIFSSELKAILRHPAVMKEIDQDALQLFLQLGYVPAPHSIFQHIQKILPAHYLTVDASALVTTKRYWQIDHTQNNTLDVETALTELEQRVNDSCRLRMIADVPVGVFLSGGIDSSLVTATLKKQGFDNLATFTIGFAEATHDEAIHARAVATHLGTKHHELTCTSKEAQEIIPELPKIFDEPFADASAIPTYLVSQFAREHVTAALSADGGDELFGGYQRYAYGDTLHRWFKRLPPGLGWFFWMVGKMVTILAIVRLLHPRFIHKFNKIHSFYTNRTDSVGMYATQQSYYTPHEVSRLLKNPTTSFVRQLFARLPGIPSLNYVRTLQKIDFHTYLPDDILVKVDRASMACSLEGREPLLDHTLVEFAATLPDELMHKELGNKYMLRQLLYKYLPQELVDRPKQGFGVPLDDWLRGDLRHLLDEFLDCSDIARQGLFNPAMVEKEKKDFLSGAQPYNRVWNLVVFQMWYKCYLGRT